ncbi:amino acid transporter AVT1C-like [Brassica napus]|uniref:vacuolar amino acid transporter 1-like n=1 Tax=Brassica oleracea var. oleracea TaxID=109376 RepID=UPI0006A6CEE5|nr:PREDICTED: vacuolar amino acid transporter 1-like [Brassica oleracea var. oleracea]XP_013634169.1 PREDICTED: vacuolar amino acid transporter 1-like [Brassica oleracea var. oleracea]XP_013699135.2 amino acid transporter AVT1C-like [Brassica napus]
MNHVPSDQSFYIESEDEDDRKDYAEEEEDGHSHSDSSDANDEHHTQNKPNSYTTAWPQSYRQSIDLYSSVPSPSIGFLGNNSMTRFGSSFLSSSLIRRHTPESLPVVTKPLLEAEEQAPPPPKHRLSSHGLLPPVPSRRSSMRKEERVSHEVPMSRNSSYGQAVMNGLNVLCGVGILSTPYAAKEGGWLGLGILFIYGLLSFYTGILLRYCLDSESDLETYPDIGQAAFGTTGRIFVSIVLYLELYACCVEYIILESDNLSSLYPNAALSIGGFELDARHLFALLTTIAVLPTVWLRDLSLLSYISAGGVIASVLVVLSLFWIGLVDDVGIHSKGTTLNLSTLPVAIGLYGYCYSGHAVFPNIYTSMANPNQYPSALLTCFTICTLMYAGVAFMGYTMFGEATESQFTLNLPQDLVATKIAVWTTVVNPFTKYALTLSPVALSLEELIPSRHNKSHWYAIAIRTALVFSTLLVGLAIPFFGLVMSLIGSLLTMLVTLILPPACFLSIVRRKVTRTQMMLCVLIIVVGAISSVIGSYSALSQIIEKLSS